MLLWVFWMRGEAKGTKVQDIFVQQSWYIWLAFKVFTIFGVLLLFAFILPLLPCELVFWQTLYFFYLKPIMESSKPPQHRDQPQEHYFLYARFHEILHLVLLFLTEKEHPVDFHEKWNFTKGYNRLLQRHNFSVVHFTTRSWTGSPDKSLGGQ